jgi:hypothetical protein
LLLEQREAGVNEKAKCPTKFAPNEKEVSGCSHYNTVVC